jgi:hypothetical protein
MSIRNRAEKKKNAYCMVVSKGYVRFCCNTTGFLLRKNQNEAVIRFAICFEPECGCAVSQNVFVVSPGNVPKLNRLCVLFARIRRTQGVAVDVIGAIDAAAAASSVCAAAAAATCCCC